MEDTFGLGIDINRRMALHGKNMIENVKVSGAQVGQLTLDPFLFEQNFRIPSGIFHLSALDTFQIVGRIYLVREV